MEEIWSDSSYEERLAKRKNQYYRMWKNSKLIEPDLVMPIKKTKGTMLDRFVWDELKQSYVINLDDWLYMSGKRKEKHVCVICGGKIPKGRRRACSEVCAAENKRIRERFYENKLARVKVDKKLMTGKNA